MEGKLQNLFACLVLAAGGIGCEKAAPLPFGQFVEPTNEDSGLNSPYAKAANLVDHGLGEKQSLLTRTTYSPGQRDFLKKACGPALELIRSTTGPVPIPGGNEGRLEWRLLARVGTWQLEDQCQNAKWDEAVRSEIQLSKFGFDLTAGSPSDASLGFIVVDDARKALAPYRDQLDVKNLRTLALGLKKVYLDRPKLSSCFNVAQHQMLQTVQDIQDGYRNNDLTPVKNAVGPQDKESVALIDKLHDEPDAKRAEFFYGFAEEAKHRASLLGEEAAIPFSRRPQLDQENPSPKGPWMRLANRLFDLGRPLLAMNDATCARTEMLILDSMIQVDLKTKGSTPPDLTKFTPALTQDPYTGEPFIYHQDGTDYKLYSVGPDLIDNDGDSDDTFSSPDLVLETPTR
jgi:hypothetical protein